MWFRRKIIGNIRLLKYWYIFFWYNENKIELFGFLVYIIVFVIIIVEIIIVVIKKENVGNKVIDINFVL